MIVVRALPRKAKVTATTSAMANNSSICTSRTELRMLCVRSVRTETVIDAGRLAESCGSRARTRSATSITLAPGWRWMFSRMAGTSPDQAARKRSSAPFSTVATSPSRKAAPSCQARISWRYPSTVRIWSLASSRVERNGPSKLPLAWLALALAMAERTVSTVRPAVASAPGFTCTRIAGRCPPARLTSPTPDTCASFCAMRVSTRS